MAMAETEAKKAMDLPKGFTPLSDIVEFKVLPKSVVNVIGLVKDFRRPIPTAKDDYKCQMSLIDMSLSESEGQSVKLDIFRPEGDMPTAKSGDVVVAHQVKTQRYRSNPLSLIKNFSTTLHIYSATTIPPPPQHPPPPSKPSAEDKKRNPAPIEGQYISWLYHNIDKTEIPEPEVFEIQANQSLNIKNKLCELQDVRDGKFHDLIVQVVKDPHDFGDKVTLYVSDYTENSGFFHYTNKRLDTNGGRDGDPYGYTHTKTRKSTSDIQSEGPFGKQTMQITCWNPHATVIRERRIKKDDWIRLFNVQIKYGSNGQNMEGFLREDRNAFKDKIYVDKVDMPEEGESMDPHVKNALRRKRDYEKQLKADSKETNYTKGTDKKRPAADQPEQKPQNAKQRRSLKRGQAAEKEKETEKEAGEGKEIETPPDLNEQVVCENHDEPAVDVATILEPATQEFVFQNAPLIVKLPFHDAQYRTHVRIVDFHPPRIQDFACVHKRNEYDVLSDYSGTDSEDDNDDDDEQGRVTIDKYVSTSEQNWEWRFALCLQDATAAKDPKTREKKTNKFWVVVDNMDAQLLTGLDACDFRTNADALSQLREKMFILWGDLEEKKTTTLAEQGKKQKANVGKKKKTSDRPPDSDDENAVAGGASKNEKLAISNRPFTCCIRQYGIQVKEPDSEKADAGTGKRWQRMYGLFGTKISGY
ncbi:telomere-binding alpha subunit central domain-containing protein [Colletotrichum limetticola]|uniref:Protection of telomeres protein 1 n=1 Tax=Colletotrichum limetticola TaxID=1209924 RepID=A0ABQ9PU00_9PEZI|nr:telomere-binding alpha subunit central domain-containing protein [Colletotrichum limetticola]